MRRFISRLAFATALLTASSALAAPETFVFDDNHTNITWHANHFGFSNPSGKFMKAEGTLTLDEDFPANSKVDITIPVNTLTTGLEKFDEHLLSKDFFDAATYPTMKFASDKVEVTGKNTANVHGMLTLHGVTRPVSLKVTLNKIGPHPMNKTKVAGFTASTTLKRSDFGMGYGIPGVADEVAIDIEAEAGKR